MKKYGLIILLFVVASILVYFFGKESNYIKTGKLYISEIVASNSYTLRDDIGEYSDYIELHNGYDYAIDLDGYHLTDSMYELDKWTFPKMEIEPNSYLIIYASGKNNCNENICHTSFKLKKDGETISLIDKTGNIISRVTYPSLLNDEAYSFIKNDYKITIPTPGKENSKEEIKKIKIKPGEILINEYLSHNKGSSYISNGGYYDWVELYNTTSSDLNLLGLSISDDADNLNKFMLPDTVIKSNGYVVIYLTGDEKVDNEICANFRLSDNDEKIVLSGNGTIIDEVDVVKLDKNVSFGRSKDKWLYYPSPTPGKENITHGVERIGQNGST